MNLSIRPLRARKAIPNALDNAMQWRLLVLWVAATLGCALLATLPLRSWLASVLNYSVHAPEIAQGKTPMLLLDVLLSPNAPWSALMQAQQTSTWLMLALSPLLAGSAVAAARSRSTLGFGDLLRGGLSEYGPMLRLLLWAIIPLGVVLAITAGIMGFNDKAHEHAILEADIRHGRNIALCIGAVLFVFAHASIEAGRGWLAADVRLRSAIKAWWRGLKLLVKRPIAVLSAYLIPALLSIALALCCLWVRQHMATGATVGGFWLGLLFSSLVAAALTWGRVARLFAMSALAADTNTRH